MSMPNNMSITYDQYHDGETKSYLVEFEGETVVSDAINKISNLIPKMGSINNIRIELHDSW